jgi:hypothetical protein
MTNLTIAAKYLPILARFTAKRDIRYQLKGFLAVPHPDGGATLVATDGHSMCVIYDKDAVCGETQIRPIPTRAVTLSKRKYATTVVYVGDDVRIAGEQLPLGAPIDAKFPDWRSAVPEPDGGTVDGMSVSTLELDKFSGIGAIRLIASSDSDAYLVRSEEYPEFLGVVMGYRYDVPSSAPLPAWASATIRGT